MKDEEETKCRMKDEEEMKDRMKNEKVEEIKD